MPACGPFGLRGHLGSRGGQGESGDCGVAMHRCRGWGHHAQVQVVGHHAQMQGVGSPYIHYNTIHTLQDHMSTKLRPSRGVCMVVRLSSGVFMVVRPSRDGVCSTYIHIYIHIHLKISK